MALMLRKACQPVLDNADLDAYHADIDENSKHLCLYTPCGKHFAFVHGVRFGKMSPTLAEINFATELLERWLHRNQKTIADFLIAWEAEQRLQGCNNQEDLGDGYKISLRTKSQQRADHRSGRQQYGEVPAGYNVSCPDKTTIEFDSEHGIRSWTNTKEGQSVIKNGYKISLPATTMKKAITFFEDWTTLSNARTRLGEIRAELNSCSDC